MRALFAVVAAIVLGACAHTDVAIHSSGATQVRSGASVQVNASGGLAAALVAGAIIAASVSEPDDFAGAPVPAMDPNRKVSEQDCTRPVTGSGNLKCR